MSESLIRGRDTSATVIVCPTPSGGHIEHACDLAIATYKATGSRAVLLTRPGALEYLPESVEEYVIVHEIIPPLVAKKDGLGRLATLAFQVRNLLTEHLQIRRLLRSIAGARVLVLEEPRYAFPQLLVPRRRNIKTCLVLHNAVDHVQASISLVMKIRGVIASKTKENVDYIAVHGQRQLELVAPTTTTSLRSFPLPGASYIHSLFSVRSESRSSRFYNISETFVCLGELRANKGLEFALEASRRSALPVLVIGKVVDPEYAAKIGAAAKAIESVEFRPEFVTPADFDHILHSCRAILLPYSQFDAQSGVLARAMDGGVSVIASDLPSLREQAGTSEVVSFYKTGSTEDLIQVMESLDQVAVDALSNRPARIEEISIPEWDVFADAVQTGW